MRGAFTIARRELRGALLTPSFFLLASSFAVLAGFCFFSLVRQFNALAAHTAIRPDEKVNFNEDLIVPYFNIIRVFVLFFVPLLSMRFFPPERRQGTFELLVTSPISVGDIVWGKFLGGAFLLVGLLFLAFLFPAVLLFVVDPERLPVVVGFAGLVLFSLAYLAIGEAVSSFSRNELTAGGMALVLLFLLHVCDAPADDLAPGISFVLRYSAPTIHAENLIRGVVVARDVIYFFSLIAIGIFFSYRGLERERWRA